MPPIPPLVPRTDEMFPPPAHDAPTITNDPLNPFTEFTPAYETAAKSEASASTLVDEVTPSKVYPKPDLTRRSEDYTSSTPIVQLERSSSYAFEEPTAFVDPQKRHSVATLTPTQTTTLGNETASALFRVEKMQALPSDNLFMHLYQAVHMVLAMKEAMWDELKERVDARDPSLTLYGWEEDDYDLHASRKRFDALLERYRG